MGNNANTVAVVWVGALHGYEWILEAWHSELENGEEDSWDCIIQTAVQVAAYDLPGAPPPTPIPYLLPLTPYSLTP